MIDHKVRVWTIGFLTGVCLVGEIVLMGMGKFGQAESAVLGGAIGILLPALVDSLAVEKRRKDPTVPALPDDDYDPPIDKPGH